MPCGTLRIAKPFQSNPVNNKIDISNIKGPQATAFAVLEPKGFYAAAVPEEDWMINFSKAHEICQSIDFSYMQKMLGSKKKQKLIGAVGLAVRSLAFENLIDKYLKQNTGTVLVHLGCGMSDRSERYRPQIDKGLPFIDIDFPDIMELRKHFYTEHGSYLMLSSDLSKDNWVNDIPAKYKASPFIFVAEGLTPYLTEEQLKKLFAQLKENFPGCILIFDTYTKFKLRSTKKQVSELFETEFKFYNEDSQVFKDWDAQYQFLEEDILIYRKEFLESKYLTPFYKWLMRFFIKRFSWHKGIIRSTVVQVFRLGE
jgi:O-methyltransferase involved in polyketide biosynthesis